MLAVGSLVALLMLIHATVDQMRPERVVRSIHELALRAHDRELRLLAGTRQARRSPRGSEERKLTASDNGYVVSVDVQALAAIARSVGPDAEIIVDCELGAYVIYGETIARIAGVAASDESHDETLLAAFRFSYIRRTESDCGYSLDQLENIAWMAGTSAAQSPYTSRAAITSLRDLVARWTSSSSDHVRSPKDQDLLPVVYEDGATSRILHTFGTLLVAASESKQAHTAATIISCFAHVLPRLRLESDRIEFRRALDAALPTVVQQVGIPTLAAALNELVGALEVEGYDTGRVLRAQARLRTAMEELASEPSSEREMPVSD